MCPSCAEGTFGRPVPPADLPQTAIALILASYKECRAGETNEGLGREGRRLHGEVHRPLHHALAAARIEAVRGMEALEAQLPPAPPKPSKPSTPYICFVKHNVERREVELCNVVQLEITAIRLFKHYLVGALL